MHASVCLSPHTGTPGLNCSSHFEAAPLVDSCVATDVVAAAPAMMFAGEFRPSVLTSRLTGNAKQKKRQSRDMEGIQRFSE